MFVRESGPGPPPPLPAVTRAQGRGRRAAGTVHLHTAGQAAPPNTRSRGKWGEAENRGTESL